MNQHRAARMAGTVRSVVGRYVVEVPPSVAQGVSITQVTISDDLQYADVFVGALSDTEAAVRHLTSRAGMMKKDLGKLLTTYTIPKLRFKADSRGAELSRLDELLDSL